MLAVQIDHVKNFMRELLLQGTFDSFLVSEVSITTFTTFSIDGQLHPEFFGPVHPLERGQTLLSGHYKRTAVSAVLSYRSAGGFRAYRTDIRIRRSFFFSGRYFRPVSEPAVPGRYPLSYHRKFSEGLYAGQIPGSCLGPLCPRMAGKGRNHELIFSSSSLQMVAISFPSVRMTTSAAFS